MDTLPSSDEICDEANSVPSRSLYDDLRETAERIAQRQIAMFQTIAHEEIKLAFKIRTRDGQSFLDKHPGYDPAAICNAVCRMVERDEAEIRDRLADEIGAAYWILSDRIRQIAEWVEEQGPAR